MTIRTWATLLWSLAAVVLFATVYNLANPAGTGRIIFALGFLLLLVIAVIRLMKSRDSDKMYKIVEDYKNGKFDAFNTDDFVVLKETSSSRVSEISEMVKAHFSKSDMEEVMSILESWKKVHNFNWSVHNVFDTLVVIAHSDPKTKAVSYSVYHDINTKVFKIKGTLEMAPESATAPAPRVGRKLREDEDTDSVIVNTSSSKYTISGVSLTLSNVLPSEVGETKMWEISSNTRHSDFVGFILREG